MNHKFAVTVCMTYAFFKRYKAELDQTESYCGSLAFRMQALLFKCLNSRLTKSVDSLLSGHQIASWNLLLLYSLFCSPFSPRKPRLDKIVDVVSPLGQLWFWKNPMTWVQCFSQKVYQKIQIFGFYPQDLPSAVENSQAIGSYYCPCCPQYDRSYNCRKCQDETMTRVAMAYGACCEH